MSATTAREYLAGLGVKFSEQEVARIAEEMRLAAEFSAPLGEGIGSDYAQRVSAELNGGEAEE